MTTYNRICRDDIRVKVNLNTTSGWNYKFTMEYLLPGIRMMAKDENRKYGHRDKLRCCGTCKVIFFGTEREFFCSDSCYEIERNMNMAKLKARAIVRQKGG